MNREAVLEDVAEERRDLCDFLGDLDASDWGRPSLCAGWTCHDVLAHLVANTEETLFGFVSALARARGSFDRMVDRQATERAAKASPAQLLFELRAAAATPNRLPGSKPADSLCDVLVHGQDIARALDRVRLMQPRRAIPAIQRATNTQFYGARKRFRGLRLIAVDADWSYGERGPAVQGPIADLLLVATGRESGLSNLEGKGMPTLTQRLTSSEPRTG